MDQLYWEIKQEGIDEGYASGKEFGIRALVESLQDLGISIMNITDSVSRKFEITEEEASAYVKKFTK
jgi:flagellar biosynthesis/type III secretory pathway protein FliH